MEYGKYISPDMAILTIHLKRTVLITSNTSETEDYDDVRTGSW